MRVVIIEEMSTVNLQHIYMAMKMFENPYKLVFIGDPFQMQSIQIGGIGHALVDAYGGTPVVHVLEKNYRSKNAKLLCANLERMIHGKSDFTYGNKIDDIGCSFTVIKINQDANSVDGSDTNHLSRLKMYLDKISHVYPDIICDIGSSRIYKKKTVHIIKQRNVDRRLINNYIFRRSYTYGNVTNKILSALWVGEMCVIKKNVYGKKEMDAKSSTARNKLRTDIVMNGECYRLNEVLDVNKENGKTVASHMNTGEKISKNCHRILLFDGEKQINLSHYSISDIDRGYCTTIASYQGKEVNVCLIYIRSPLTYMTREQFYTACSRAKKRVIILDGSDSDTIENTSRIILNQRETKPCTHLSKKLPLPHAITSKD